MTGLPRFALLAVVLAGACQTAGSKPPATPAARPPAPVITVDLKMGWVLRLEQQRITRDPGAPPAGEPAMPELASAAAAPLARKPATGPSLVALSLDTDVIIRRRALLALGRIRLAENAPVLVNALGDTDEYTREAGAFGLGLLQLRSTVPALEAALKADASPAVRGRIAEALGLIGDVSAADTIAGASADCRGRIASIDADDEAWPKPADVEQCRLSLFALVRLHAFDALARVALDASGQPVARWWPVAYALQRINDARAVPALLTLASGAGTYTRAFAVRGLAAAGDRRAVPLATTYVADRTADVRLRIAAVRVLGERRPPEGVGPLIAVLRDRTAPHNLRLEAVTALGAIGDRQTFDALIDLWTDPSAAIRAAAIGAAARVHPGGFLLVVSSLTPDPDWSVRAALATALGTLPPDQAASAVDALYHDTDGRVRGPALDALARLRVADLPARIAEALASTDIALRTAAVALVADQHAPDAVERLTAVYEAAEGGAAAGVRAAVIDALAKLGGDPAKTVLHRALSDPDWALRVRAASALHGMGEPGAAPTPPAPLRGPADVFESAALLHPRYSPHAFLDTARGTIEIELDVLDAPFTSASFVALARAGFFNGMSVHRLVPNFVLQTGDPRGDGEGGPGYSLRDELSVRPYLRGTVGMALDGADSGGSQFFITVSPQPHLDAKYTVFGTVVAGMGLLDQVARGDVITRVTIWDGETGK